MHAVTAQQLERIGQTIALRLIEVSGVDVSSVALDMTNFATFITTANAKAPIAQRGKAKQKRSDLRLVGLGLVVTRDGGIPLTWHAYPGDKPDVTQFPPMIDQLRRRYEAITAAAGRTSGSAEMTVVFDAGQNSADNFAHLAGSGLHYIGSVPISDCPDLAALPATVRTVVDARFEGLTAHDTRREVYGTVRRTILTHSPELHESQACGFDGTTPGQGRHEARCAGHHPRPRQDPPTPRRSRGRDRRNHPHPLGAPRRHLAADRRRTRRPAPGMEHRHHRPRGAGRRTVRQARADHRPRRLAGRPGRHRLPVPIRGRVRLPAAQRSPRGVVCCPALKMTMTPSLSMKTKMVALVATLTG